MKTEKRSLGDRGEEAAAAYLKKAHYRILARNLQIGHHEIDLIAEDREHLIFVEVKTRTYSEANIQRYGAPCAAVNARKRAYLIAAVRSYLKTHPAKKHVRFDVIEVLFSPADGTEAGKLLSVHHMPDAFRA